MFNNIKNLKILKLFSFKFALILNNIKINRYRTILCDLFGMVKWPFQRLSDLQLGDQKGHFDSPGKWIFIDRYITHISSIAKPLSSTGSRFVAPPPKCRGSISGFQAEKGTSASQTSWQASSTCSCWTVWWGWKRRRWWWNPAKARYSIECIIKKNG